MKIVVLGGTGRIGSRLVATLAHQGHTAAPAAPETGVDVLSGKGLAEALEGAEVLVDLINSPSFDAAAIDFFQTAGRNVAKAERGAGIRHHVLLSVVGADRLPESGYLRAKLAQEAEVKACGLPYTIIRSTQFFPFIEGIIAAGVKDGEIRLPSALMQPIDPEDVVATLAEIATGAPVNGTVEIAGPEAIPINRFAEEFLSAKADPRLVVPDPTAQYFGTPLAERSLTPGPGARLSTTSVADWLRESIAAD